MPTGTYKLLEQYILSLKRTGNVRSPGGEGITCTLHFMLQGNATRGNTYRGKKKKAMCEDQEKNSIALLSKLIYDHYLQCLM